MKFLQKKISLGWGVSIILFISAIILLILDIIIKNMAVRHLDFLANLAYLDTIVLGIYIAGITVLGFSGAFIYRYIRNKYKAEHLLLTFVTEILHKTGFDYIRALAEQFWKHFHIDVVVIGKLVDSEKQKIQTLVVLQDGKIVENFEFELEGTPCKELAKGVVCEYPQDIQSNFPQDERLKKWGVQSVKGIPILDSSQKPVGILELFLRKPLKRTEILDALFYLASDRISAELERIERETTILEKEKRLKDFNDILLQLSKIGRHKEDSLSSIFQEITEADARALQVERVGIWLFVEEGQKIQCVDLYERSKEIHSSGKELFVHEYPAYFEALKKELLIAASDAHKDPRTREFSSSYLSPIGISSMLDVPIRKGGEIIGVLCHEQIGSPRQWTEEERSFVLSMADFIAQSIEFHQRMEVEKSLKQTQDKLSNILYTVSDGIISVNRENKIIVFNKGAERIFGYDHTEMLGKDIRSLVPDTLKEKVLRVLGSIFQGDASTPLLKKQFEVQGRRKNGDIFPIEISVSKLVMGDEIIITAVLRDISERKRIESQLRKLSQVVEQSPLSVMITDRAGTIEYVNPAFTQITGYSAEEVIGKNPKILQSGKTTPNIYKTMWDRVASGEIWQGELLDRKKSGQEYWALSLISPIKNKDGLITHYLGIQEDITRQKKLEEQLFQAQKMESIGRLAGGVAHDFNNLLTPILAYSQFLIPEFSEGDPIREDLEQIRNAGERAARLTRQLLAFSRKQILKLEVLNINEIVGESEKMFRRVIGEDIDFVTILDPELGFTKIDPGQFEQILMNLIINARDAMPQGGKIILETLNVELDENYTQQHAQVHPGSYVMLGVSDNGMGMDAETQARIFEPFFTTKEKGKGTGLGLATVYGIVKQSGGYIWVYSEPGKGTTFKIYFPRVREDASEFPAKEILIDTFQGNENILVVEDEEVVRRSAIKILTKYGYNVFEASNAGEALLIAEQLDEPIHLLLTDVIMPKMSGVQLASRLMELQPQMAVLYMSGYTDNAIVHHGVLDSDKEFLEKPFTPETLTRKVREVLEKKRLSGQNTKNK
ncbi:MAG: PAS domain S-box protein [Calditrichaeota bacterium]|nr:PAS domain S-box protein [Calditrichota bacterium]